MQNKSSCLYFILLSFIAFTVFHVDAMNKRSPRKNLDYSATNKSGFTSTSNAQRTISLFPPFLREVLIKGSIGAVNGALYFWRSKDIVSMNAIFPVLSKIATISSKKFTWPAQLLANPSLRNCCLSGSLNVVTSTFLFAAFKHKMIRRSETKDYKHNESTLKNGLFLVDTIEIIANAGFMFMAGVAPQAMAIQLLVPTAVALLRRRYAHYQVRGVYQSQ